MHDDRPGIAELYTRAVAEGSPRDVVGAMAFAGRRAQVGGRSSHGTPIGAALYRLFSGDGQAAKVIVRELAGRAVGKQASSGRALDILDAERIAERVLAWHRNGRCPSCSGLGQLVIPGTTTLHRICGDCGGSGRIDFDSQFEANQQWIARWMSVKIEEEQAKAADLAMRALAIRIRL